MVSDVIRRHESEKGNAVWIDGIKRVRFRSPVRPDESISISFTPPLHDGDRSYSFKVVANGETICTGVMTARPVDEGYSPDA